jgi:hypothetical protein
VGAAHHFYERACLDPTPPAGLSGHGALLECGGIGGGDRLGATAILIVVDIMSLIGELDLSVDQVNFSPDRLALLQRGPVGLRRSAVSWRLRILSERF